VADTSKDKAAAAKAGATVGEGARNKGWSHEDHSVLDSIINDVLGEMTNVEKASRKK
jgi:hypothetical protein